jgi:hypothetical protein
MTQESQPAILSQRLLKSNILVDVNNLTEEQSEDCEGKEHIAFLSSRKIFHLRHEGVLSNVIVLSTAALGDEKGHG